MAQTKNVQWKYQNNSVIIPGFIKAELTQDDCLKAGNKFYVATIPAGAILKSIIAYSTCDMVEAPALVVDIGANNCEFCVDNKIELSTKPTCIKDCECTLTDRDYVVVVTLTDDIPTGCVTLLFEVINPNFVSGCAVEPVELEYETKIIEPCTTSGCPEKCPDSEQAKTNLVTQVATGIHPGGN